MSRRRIPSLLLILLLACFAVISGYHYITRSDTPTGLVPAAENVTPVPISAPSRTASESAVLALAAMSEREKFSQLLVLPKVIQDPSVKVATNSATESDFAVSPGAVLILGQEISENEATTAIDTLKQTYSVHAGDTVVQPLIMVDHEGGTVQRLSGSGFTKLPSWRELCLLSQQERVVLLLRSAVELRTVGVDVVLGPVLDMAKQNRPLGDRICSDEIIPVMEAASDYVTVFLASRIMPVYKHFPGIGQVTVDLHRRFASTLVSQNDVVVYEKLLKRFPEVPVMVSHVGVENQFATIPCSQSPSCVQELLIAYPDRLIITDALDMWSARALNGSVTIRRPIAEVAVDAVRAGNTLLLFGERMNLEDQEAVLQAITTEYRADPVFATQVETAATKIVQFKLERAAQKGLLP